MLKIRRPNGRLIFNMEIAIRRKDGFCIDTGPWALLLCVWVKKDFEIVAIHWTSYCTGRINWTPASVCMVLYHRRIPSRHIDRSPSADGSVTKSYPCYVHWIVTSNIIVSCPRSLWNVIQHNLAETACWWNDKSVLTCWSPSITAITYIFIMLFWFLLFRSQVIIFEVYYIFGCTGQLSFHRK